MTLRHFTTALAAALTTIALAGCPDRNGDRTPEPRAPAPTTTPDADRGTTDPNSTGQRGNTTGTQGGETGQGTAGEGNTPGGTGGTSRTGQPTQPAPNNAPP